MDRWDKLAKAQHALAVSKGWWDQPLEDRIPMLLDWIIEEANEAKEAWEQHGFLEWQELDNEGLEKPEGFPVELADILLVVMDLKEGTEMSLLDTAARKIKYNQVRKYRRDAKGNKIDA